MKFFGGFMLKYIDNNILFCKKLAQIERGAMDKLSALC